MEEFGILFLMARKKMFTSVTAPGLSARFPKSIGYEGGVTLPSVDKSRSD